jgi:hypothetical protein
MPNKILEVLDPFRKSLQADGADLQVLHADEQNLKIELVINDATCLDCIVPKAIMENIIVSQLQKIGMTFTTFELRYPEI